MAVLIVCVNEYRVQRAHFYKFVQDSISIGRGFSNDVILSDPFVADSQVGISLVGGGYRLDVFDSTNPVSVNGKPVSRSVFLGVDDVVSIGRSQFSLHQEAQAVAPVQKLQRSRFFSPFLNPLFGGVALLLLLGVSFLQLFLGSFAEIDWAELVGSVFGVCLIVVLWAGFWAFLAHLQHRRARFWGHLCVTCVVVLLFIFFEVLVEYVLYVSSFYQLNQFVWWVVTPLLLMWLLFYNLLFSCHLKRCFLIAAGLSFVFFSVFFGLDLLKKDVFSSVPEHSRVLKPPFADVGRKVGVEGFLRESDLVFERFVGED